MRRLVVAMIVCLAAMSSTAMAMCVIVDVDVPLTFRHADLVFRGTLRKVENSERLTFEVERVWKGVVPRQLVVYQSPLHLYSIDRYVFKIGGSYLLFASRLTPDERAAADVPPNEDPAFGIPSGCSAAPWPLMLVPELDKIARAKKPRGRMPR